MKINTMNKNTQKKLNTSQPPTQRNQRSTAQKKADFLKAMEKSLGIIQTACDMAKVNRGSVYRWLENDEKFLQAIRRDVRDVSCEFAESKLLQRIQGMTYEEEVVVRLGKNDFKIVKVKKYLPPDTKAIVDYLGARGGHLGYGKQKLEHSGEITTKSFQVMIENPHKKED
ncbi:hypothetical protein M23134_06478 [Microscilla marina ATCC 23134]|uniref:Terminase small subunit n=2 Tax=Microscilla marina TaxID=1027 RepID=A1ZYR7_MICM2|nr:hypothetical protein M23134_06478 [Microscilla marina ATCC 23134]